MGKHHQQCSVLTKNHQRIYFFIEKSSTILFSYGKVINHGFFHMEQSLAMIFSKRKTQQQRKNPSTVIFYNRNVIKVDIFLFKGHQRLPFLTENTSTIGFSYGKSRPQWGFNMDKLSTMIFSIRKLIHIGETPLKVIFCYRKFINNVFLHVENLSTMLVSKRKLINNYKKS